MVNKPFYHISDFVLASYTFSCMKTSDFVPNNRHLREVLIFFFHSKKENLVDNKYKDISNPFPLEQELDDTLQLDESSLDKTNQ